MEEIVKKLAQIEEIHEQLNRAVADGNYEEVLGRSDTAKIMVRNVVSDLRTYTTVIPPGSVEECPNCPHKRLMKR